MKRSPIAPTSRKRAKLLRERRKLTDAMKENGLVMCQFPVRGWGVEGPVDGVCNRRADDYHEIVSRARGGSITDPENCVPLCRPHHDWVTTHPREAAELGLSKRRPVESGEGRTEQMNIAELVAKLDLEAFEIEACDKRGAGGICPECKKWGFLLDVRRIMVAAQAYVEARTTGTNQEVGAAERELFAAVRGEA